MKKRYARNALLLVLSASLGLSGCATTGSSDSNGSTTSSFMDSSCNTGIAAIAGGLAGALISKGNNKLGGAVIGAGVASLACVAWNYNVQQTKTAAQVEQDYKAAHAGQLPEQSRVVSYRTRFTPNAKVAPGEKIVVSSNIEVVNGKSGVAPTVEEELSLIKPDGSAVTTKKRANENGESGAFKTSYTLTMPSGVPQGKYPVKTVLYVDGSRVKTNRLTMQVVMLPGGQMVASLAP